MLGYRVPAPNEAMLISGGKQKAAGDSTLPFKIVTGHGAKILCLVEMRIGGHFARRIDRGDRDAPALTFARQILFAVLHRPGGDHRVDLIARQRTLRAVLEPLRGKARIADPLHQGLPVLRLQRNE